jgi:glucuronoarabinoxylan endo-1,4-beta-xylanase
LVLVATVAGAMRRTLVISLAVAVVGPALVAASAGARGATGQRASAATIRVDLGAKRQVMQGFGSSVRVWSDPHLTGSPTSVVPPTAQAAILTALYRRLGLTRSRQILDGGIERTPGGPFDFEGKLGQAQIAYVRQAERYGLRVFFPGPVYIESWMTADNAAAYVDYAMGILQYWRSKGLEPPFYALMNEPQNAGDFPPSWMHDVTLQLGRRLQAAGFKTKLVIPDDENPADAYRRAVAVVQDPQARRFVGALAYHIYRGSLQDIERIGALGARYHLPVWMTEYSTETYASWPQALDWAVKIHTLVTAGDVSAVDYLFAFFGNSPDAPISIHFANGRYAGFELLPTYWITGQWSRFVRPGFVRVAASPANGQAVLASAYRGDGKLVVVAVNTAQTTDLRVVVRGGRLVGRVLATSTSSADRWRPVLAVRRESGFVGTLSGQSVTTFVGRLAR